MRDSILSKRFCLLLLSFCAFTVHSQDLLWEKSYGGKHAGFLSDAIPTPDYGFILAGRQLQQVKRSGEKIIPFDLSKLPSGTYIINVETNVEKNGIKVIKR